MTCKFLTRAIVLKLQSERVVTGPHTVELFRPQRPTLHNKRCRAQYNMFRSKGGPTVQSSQHKFCAPIFILCNGPNSNQFDLVSIFLPVLTIYPDCYAHTLDHMSDIANGSMWSPTVITIPPSCTRSELAPDSIWHSFQLNPLLDFA